MGSKVIVKSLEINLIVNQSFSLKDKRQVIKSIKAKVRRKFNVSIAEVDLMDSLKETVLAVVLVSNKNNYADKVLDKIMDFINKNYDVEIVDSRRLNL